MPILIMVVAAPLTPHTPWETRRTTSFGAMELSASSKLVIFVSPSWNAPSAAVGKSMLTLVMPVPQVQVFRLSPKQPRA